ncbi:MAG: glycosyltransferase family 4 protein [Acidobacteriota bacterium]|nr:glycosyltransferase family 4 protein [Acidobacteriota bacterium]
MRAAYITAGAAGMYCGSCLHDNTLAAALQRQGHDIALIPTYTPIRTDETDVSIDRVFYGALNVYLEQKIPMLRKAPRSLGRFLDAKPLLNWISRIGASTDPHALGELTLSVLQGEDGKQRQELEELVAWLRDDYRPQIVHITNSMFLGTAHRIKEQLGVPVLCTVQGEDIFLEELPEPIRTRVHDKLREKAADVDGFVSTSRAYAEYMANYLEIPAEKIHHLRLGLHLEGHGEAEPNRDESPFVIGYLARICPEKGLHLLTEAFRQLAEKKGKDRVLLRIAGWLGARDRKYFDALLAQVRSWGLDDRVEHVGEVDREGKIAFLQSLHVLSVPTVYRDPKGLFVLEALANGVPVVQPRHGAFPEMIEATGGGVLVEPGYTPAIAEVLEALMDDPERREALGRAGKAAVHAEWNDEVLARATLALYAKFLH